MSNITKNLLLALTMVCIIALIVFCIQLIVLNRGVTPDSPGATVSGGSQQGSSSGSGSGTGASAGSGDSIGGSQDGDFDDGDIGDGGPDGGNDPGSSSGVVRPPPQGTRRSIAVTPTNRLIVYSDDTLFEYIEGDLDWWFIYTGQGEATFEIQFSSVVSQGGISVHTEEFLNNYANTRNASVTREESIHGSSLRGYHAIARVGTGTYEVWMHPMTNSDLALAFIIYYENERQRESLYDMLSWLDIE